MIRHTVLLRFFEGVHDAAVDAFIEGLQELPSKIPCIVTLSYGRDAGRVEYPDQLAANWDFVVSTTLPSMSDYLDYATHPSHLELIEKHVVHLVKERAAVQVNETSEADMTP